MSGNSTAWPAACARGSCGPSALGVFRATALVVRCEIYVRRVRPVSSARDLVHAARNGRRGVLHCFEEVVADRTFSPEKMGEYMTTHGRGDPTEEALAEAAEH